MKYLGKDQICCQRSNIFSMHHHHHHKGEMSVRMSDIAEDDSVEEEWKKKKKEEQDDPKVQKQSLKVGSEEGKQKSLHSQMAKKVGATDCIIVVGTTGLGKSTCVNLYTGQVLVMMLLMMMMIMLMVVMIIMMIMKMKIMVVMMVNLTLMHLIHHKLECKSLQELDMLVRNETKWQ